MMFQPIQPCDVKQLVKLLQDLKLGGEALEIGHGISTGVLAAFFDNVDVVDITPPRMGLPGNVRYHGSGIHAFHTDKKYRFVFIDGDHRYAHVKDDIHFALAHITENAVICGHDYNSPVYDEAHVDQDYVNGVHHGVTKAVNELFGVPHVTPEGVLWWWGR